MIYYDRQFLYHPTTSDGCRYKCIFTNTTQSLSRGDVVVFSARFSVELSITLKKRGVLIAFETLESPVHAPIPLPAQLNQVSGACSNAETPAFYVFVTIFPTWQDHGLKTTQV